MVVEAIADEVVENVEDRMLVDVFELEVAVVNGLVDAFELEVAVVIGLVNVMEFDIAE